MKETKRHVAMLALMVVWRKEGLSEEDDIKAKQGKGVAYGRNSMCKDPENEGKSGDTKITKLSENSGVRI